jgi:predicted  nucleic acid-binding Zn-ribbon protein
MSDIKETLENDVETYKKAILEKKGKLQEYRSAIGQLEAEIAMFSGALQQSEKLLKSINPEAFEDAKPAAE